MTSMTVERYPALPMPGGVHLFANLHGPTADGLHSVSCKLRRKMISWCVVGYSEIDPLQAELTLLILRISARGVRELARHSVADEVAGRRLRRRGHVQRFRGGSAAR
jgi:hypothetical protein